MRISDWSSDVCSSDPGDQGLAVACLELVELAAVDHARDDLADVERAPGVLRHDAVQLARRVQRLARLAHGKLHGLAAIEVADRSETRRVRQECVRSV